MAEDDIDDLLATLSDDDPADDSSGEPAPLQPEVVQEYIREEAKLPEFDPAQHIRRYEAVSEEILGTWRADRSESQNAISLIRSMIDDMMAGGKQPTASLMEVYVNAIKAKTDTSSVALKLLDSSAKLMTATKSNVNITTHNNQTNLTLSGDLNDILSHEIGPDDV